jgi:hypothetical protein
VTEAAELPEEKTTDKKLRVGSAPTLFY